MRDRDEIIGLALVIGTVIFMLSIGTLVYIVAESNTTVKMVDQVCQESKKKISGDLEELCTYMLETNKLEYERKLTPR